MRKYLLSLSREGRERQVAVHPFSDDLTVFSGDYLVNPIFTATQSDLGSLDLCGQPSCFILFCFTTQSFRLIGDLASNPDNEYVLKRTFYTAGLASVVIFLDNESQANELRLALDGFASGFELWNVQKGIIREDSIETFFPPSTNPPSCTQLSITQLPLEYRQLFREIKLGINQTVATAQKYAPAYLPLLRDVSSAAKSLEIHILFMADAITDTAFREELSKLYSDKNEAENLDHELESVIKAKSTQKDQIIRLNQLKDEGVQLSAVLQNFYRQAFSGAAPIFHGASETGENSLLGIGSSFAALVSLYYYCREIFSIAADTPTIAKAFSEMSSPDIQLLDPGQPLEWVGSLSSLQGLDTALQKCKPCVDFCHLPYFSNRLGFRETKYSITGSVHSLRLAALPQWNMCTIFHEYLHAHVRSLFSEIYPVSSTFTQERFFKIYRIYANRRKNPHGARNVLDLLQVTYMSAIQELENTEAEQFTQNVAMPFGKMAIAVRKWHHNINEIVVHILDFSYFYQYDPKDYIKGIWSSWLKLPFIYSRIQEYLIRSICAVASISTSAPDDAFDESIEIVKRYLMELREYPYTNERLLEDVLNHLNDDRNLRIRFHCYYPVIHVTVRFLLSAKIARLLSEPTDRLQSDGGYSLELTPGAFENRTIASPVRLLSDYLRHAFLEPELFESPDNIEALSTWLFAALSLPNE